MAHSQGETIARVALDRGTPFFPGMADLKGLPFEKRFDGAVARVEADGSLWRFNFASTTTGDDILVSTPSDALASGRWVRCAGPAILALPIGFATADATALLTLSASSVVEPKNFAWKVTTGFTGGSASAIGVSSGTATGYTTKGNFLGAAAGDVTATLGTAGTKYGTAGSTWDTIAHQRLLLQSADTIRFDRITSIYTAGAGFVLVSVNIWAEAT